MTSSVTYEEMECRNLAVLHKTARASVLLRTRGWLSMVRLAIDLNLLDRDLGKLLEIFSGSAAVRSKILERATAEQRASLAAALENAHTRLPEIIERSEKVLPPSIFAHGLKHRNQELGALLEAIRSDESVAILLTERDRRRIIRSLLEPEEANPKLVEAFRRYHD